MPVQKSVYLRKELQYQATMQRRICQKLRGPIAVSLFVAAFLVLVAAIVFPLFRPVEASPFARDPRFVVTALPQISMRPGAGLVERGFIQWLQIQQRLLGRHPGTYSFGANPTMSCSIHGLLIQCTEVSGVRYVIPKDVAAGSVQFGHTNVLTGPQWVRAFTETLQHGQPQWWDSQNQRMVNENLLLVTNDARTVMVLPRAMVQEFPHRAAN